MVILVWVIYLFIFFKSLVLGYRGINLCLIENGIIILIRLFDIDGKKFFEEGCEDF